MRLELDKSQTACKQDIFDKWLDNIMSILTVEFRVMENLFVCSESSLEAAVVSKAVNWCKYTVY